MTTYKAIVNKVSYCGFSAIIDRGNNEKKVIFFQMYAPAGGTTKPNYTVPTDPTLNGDFLNQDTITKEEFIDFWSSDIVFQEDGRFKGGKWGLDNCVPSEKSSWVPGLFIGSNITFTISETKPDFDMVEANQFTYDIKGTPKNARKNLYVTEQPMPQIAIDSIFLLNLSGEYYIKMISRGNTNTVDLKGKISIGAGEHVENIPKKNQAKPSSNYNGIKIYATGKGRLVIGQLRNKQSEEFGQLVQKIEELEKSGTIQKNSSTTGVYSFTPDSRLNRDARYSKYCIKKGTELIYFGYDRLSISDIYIDYFEYTATTNELKEKALQSIRNVKPINNVEVDKIYMIKLKDIFNKFTTVNALQPKIERWGWESHLIFIQYLLNLIKKLGDSSFQIDNYSNTKIVKKYFETDTTGKITGLKENSLMGQRKIPYSIFGQVPIQTGIQSGGRKNKSSKKTQHKKTNTYIMVGSLKRIVYSGIRGGKYIKKNGKFVSIKQLHK
jgi:hypothetical protein